MTCVIGTDRWICADRRITSDAGDRCPNERKVWRNAFMIVAGAGAAFRLHKVRDLMAGGLDRIAPLIEACGDDTHVLVLQFAAMRLIEISEGAMYRRKGVFCIGSGGDLARGYLAGRRLTEDNARAAQRFAARLRCDCGGGVDFERI